MKSKSACWHGVLLILLVLSLLPLTSCASTGTQSSSFYDAGDSDLTETSAQFAQYSLFRFDTTASSHTLTTPSAANIVADLSSPVVGEVIVFAVVADGSYAVTIMGGTGVTVRPSASTVAANTTLMILLRSRQHNFGRRTGDSPLAGWRSNTSKPEAVDYTRLGHVQIGTTRYGGRIRTWRAEVVGLVAGPLS